MDTEKYSEEFLDGYGKTIFFYGALTGAAIAGAFYGAIEGTVYFLNRRKKNQMKKFKEVSTN